MKKIIFFFCLSSLSLTAQVPNYVPTNGLVAYYPFDGNANDVSGSRNNGAVNGATLTSDRFGYENKAYSFDGINDFIQMVSSGPTGNGPLTVSLWYQDSNFLANRCAISYGGNSWGTYFEISLNWYSAQTQNRCYGPSILAGGTGISWGSSSQYSASWHNIVIVVPKDAATVNNLFAYLDGNLVSSVCSSANYGAPNLNFSASNPLLIGKSWDSSPLFNGKLDDIAIWNRALTPEEITNLYNSDSTCQSLVINTGVLSFNPPTYYSTVTVYPNPANDQITIDCGNLTNVSGWNIKITNTIGQEVFSQPMNTQQYVVPLNTWSGQGVYFVKLYNAQGVLVNTKKIILQ
jgi:hypothetical protein